MGADDFVFDDFQLNVLQASSSSSSSGDLPGVTTDDAAAVVSEIFGKKEKSEEELAKEFQQGVRDEEENPADELMRLTEEIEQLEQGDVDYRDVLDSMWGE